MERFRKRGDASRESSPCFEPFTSSDEGEGHPLVISGAVEDTGMTLSSTCQLFTASSDSFVVILGAQILCGFWMVQAGYRLLERIVVPMTTGEYPAQCV
jgi:hypothetical protein